MKWLSQTVLLAAAVLAGAVGSAYGCTACYVSKERMVRHSRVILEMEVTVVHDLPGEASLSAEADAERRGCLAEMKINRVIKGECAQKELTVQGGPYVTCLPGHYYVQFTPGEKLFLVLDSPLKPQAEAIVVSHYNRIQKIPAAEMTRLMTNARSAWQAAVERHRRADPSAMREAAAQMEAPAGDFSRIEMTSQPYAVLACLRLLLNDPDHLPPPTEGQEPDFDFLMNYGRVPAKVRDHPGIIISDPSVRPFSPKPLIEAIAEKGRTNAREVAEFNERVLRSLLTDELHVPSDIVTALLEDEQVQSGLSHPLHDPIWMGRLASRNAKARTINSVSALLMLAAPEPDYARHGLFGGRAAFDDMLMPEVFLPYFRKQGLIKLTPSTEALSLLLKVPHPEIAAKVSETVEVTDENADLLFRYFVLSEANEALPSALAVIENRIATFLRQAPSLNPVQREERRSWETSRVVDLAKMLEERDLKGLDSYRGLVSLIVRLSQVD